MNDSGIESLRAAKREHGLGETRRGWYVVADGSEKGRHVETEGEKHGEGWTEMVETTGIVIRCKDK